MKNNIYYILITGLFIFLSITCKSPESNLTLPEPNPASAEITLDSTSSITEIIDQKGGSIEIKGTDGLNYRFTVPEGFLLSETSITMTPIATLTSPVLEQFAAGVHFEPNGLVFPGITWLEISGADLSDNLVGITYEDDGEEVGFSRAEVKGSTIRIPITHFSGTGAGTPAPDASDYSPTDALESLAYVLSMAYINNESECLSPKHEVAKGVVKMYENLLETDILPKLESASKNDLLLASAIEEYVVWQTWRAHWEPVLCEAIGRFKKEDEAEKYIDLGFKNALETAAKFCSQTYDVGETRHMIQWLEVSQYLAIVLKTDFNLTEITFEKVKECLTFELQFSSLIETKEGNASGFSGALNSTIEPLFPEGLGQLLGWVGQENYNEPAFGPLEYTPDLRYPSKPGCDVIITKINTKPASALIAELTSIPSPARKINIRLNESSDGELGLENKDTGGGETNNEVMLIFFPLEGSEFIEATCSDLWGGPNPDGTFGTSFFNYLHEDSMKPEHGGFGIVLEVQGSGKLYARKTFERSRYEDGIMITERTSFDLYHKPGNKN